MKFGLTIYLLVLLGFGLPFPSHSPLGQPADQEKHTPRETTPSLKRNPRKRGKVSETKGHEDKEGESNGEEIVRVETTLVTCDVLVHDKQGRYIKGLTASDFNVIEDGQPQQITTFSLGDDLARPRAIALIIDYSGSQLPYIKTSVDAAKTLVDKLNPDDRMAIITDDVSVLVDFTQDKAKLKGKLESLRKKPASGERLGRSYQYSALMATMNSLSGIDGFRPIIIFQTDGDELSTLRPVASYPPPPWMKEAAYKEFSINDVSVTALKSRVTIYTVIPGVRFIGVPAGEQLERARSTLESYYASLAELRSLSDERRGFHLKKDISNEQLQRTAEIAGIAAVSGGWTDFLEKPEQAAEVYSRIFKDINHRYVIGYQPTNKEREGKLRRLIIEVRGHPEYVVWGRKSYYATDVR
jgi:VWFA-related protein